MGRGHARRHAAANRWERVTEPVQHELSDGVADGNALTSQEAGGRGSTDRAVNGGEAEAE